MLLLLKGLATKKSQKNSNPETKAVNIFCYFQHYLALKKYNQVHYPLIIFNSFYQMRLK